MERNILILILLSVISIFLCYKWYRKKKLPIELFLQVSEGIKNRILELANIHDVKPKKIFSWSLALLDFCHTKTESGAIFEIVYPDDIREKVNLLSIKTIDVIIVDSLEATPPGKVTKRMNLSVELNTKLDQMSKDIGARSRRELMGNALGLYFWLSDQKNLGNTIMYTFEGEEHRLLLTPNE